MDVCCLINLNVKDKQYFLHNHYFTNIFLIYLKDIKLVITYSPFSWI